VPAPDALSVELCAERQQAPLQNLRGLIERPIERLVLVGRHWPPDVTAIAAGANVYHRAVRGVKISKAVVRTCA